MTQEIGILCLLPFKTGFIESGNKRLETFSETDSHIKFENSFNFTKQPGCYCEVQEICNVILEQSIALK